MAGLGRKVWEALDVLSAADVNGYLMDQSVMVFDNAADRLSQVPAPSEGMMAYTKDDDLVQVYNGTAWASVDTTISSINASNVVNSLVSSAATSLTFTSDDQGKTLRFTASGTVVTTLSTATAFSAGQRVDILADGAAGMRVVTGAGVTLAGGGSAGTAYLVQQYDAATIMAVASNTYRIIGNIEAV